MSDIERDRDMDMATRPLGPESLCGSYFRCPDQDDPDAEGSWLEHQACSTQEGIVVAQVYAAAHTVIYLVEFYAAHGATGYQRLVGLEQMLHQRWSFFDSVAWLTNRPTGAEADREDVA
jgi:hypothetical protein